MLIFKFFFLLYSSDALYKKHRYIKMNKAPGLHDHRVGASQESGLVCSAQKPRSNLPSSHSFVWPGSGVQE